MYFFLHYNYCNFLCYYGNKPQNSPNIFSLERVMVGSTHGTFVMINASIRFWILLRLFFRNDAISPQVADVIEKVMSEDKSLLNQQDEQTKYSSTTPTPSLNESNSMSPRSNSQPYILNSESYTSGQAVPNKEGLYFCHLCSFSGECSKESSLIGIKDGVAGGSLITSIVIFSHFSVIWHAMLVRMHVISACLAIVWTKL